MVSVYFPSFQLIRILPKPMHDHLPALIFAWPTTLALPPFGRSEKARNENVGNDFQKTEHCAPFSVVPTFSKQHSRSVLLRPQRANQIIDRYQFGSRAGVVTVTLMVETVASF